MQSLSLAVFLLEGDRISSVPICDPALGTLLHWNPDALCGRPLTEILPEASAGTPRGSLYAGGVWLDYVQQDLPGGQRILLLLNSDFEEQRVYRFAMDLLDIGVQIYRNDTTLLYINSASEAMSGIRREAVLGKRLTDIYDTDEQHSTVLSALSSRSPLYNKLDSFDVRNGVYTTVFNSSVPYFSGEGALRAVVNLEYNQVSLEKLSTTIQELREIVPQNGGKESHGIQGKYYRFEDIIGQSPNLLEVLELAKKAALQESNVFIVGETGTGKELVAQSIFSYAAGRYKSFVAINCSTIPEELADATLFGSVKGAFTDSVNSDGMFAAADGGILFLDEINSLSLNTQARLLRVLQEGAYMKVGSTREISCRVRILSSSNQNPWDLVQMGKFRQDLFYRLTATVLELPPLRERRSDIVLLANYFLRYYAKKFVKNVSYFSGELQALLSQYDWPGNIRELKNIVEFAVNAADGPEIDTHHLPRYLQNKRRMVLEGTAPTQEFGPGPRQSLSEQLEQYEMELIGRALQQYDYNITQTADSLKISRQALQYKLKKYHFNRLGG